MECPPTPLDFFSGFIKKNRVYVERTLKELQARIRAKMRLPLPELSNESVYVRLGQFQVVIGQELEHLGVSNVF